MAEYYLWIKSLHLISMVSWMAGMLYLPRIYVYHTENKYNLEVGEVFKVMERKLLRIIINPAMIMTLIFGLALIHIVGFKDLGKWFHIKILLLFAMFVYHGKLISYRKEFEKNIFKRSSRFYRIFNEVPAILMMFIIILAVVKPF